MGPAFGGIGDDRDPQVAVDAQGEVAAGSFQNQVAFGAVNLVSKKPDIFVAKLRV
jgi:hypothetical protein